MKYRLAIFLSLICLLASSDMPAQNNSFNIKDSTYSYYMKVESRILDNDVFSMIDTLFDMAVKDGDVRMQAVAMTKYVDHYYNLRNLDSLRVYVQKAKNFASKSEQPVYYFFSWKRLITCYINMNYYSMAIHELEMMQKEAMEEKYISGIVDAYDLTVTVYYSQSLYDLAIEFYQKAIDFVKENNVDYFNLSIIYVRLGYCQANAGQVEESFKSFQNANKVARSVQQKHQIYEGYVDYYVKKNDLVKAANFLDSVKSLNVNSPNSFKSLYKSQMKYEFARGNYKEALRMTDSLSNLTDNSFAEIRIECLAKMGRYKEALEESMKFSHRSDSIHRLMESSKIGENMAIMEVDRINSEKTEAEAKIKSQGIQFLAVSLILCLFIAIVAILFFVKVYKLNKKLLASKSELEKTIKQLEETVEYRNEFFKHISHEIRTPLNLIVGFAQLIADNAGQSSEMKQYAMTVNTNCDLLLRTLSDMIDVSKYCNYAGSVEKTIVDINSACYELFEKVKIKSVKKLDFIFEPSPDMPKFRIYHVGFVKVVEKVLDNAVKFTNSGYVKLSISQGNRNIIIAVEDTGTGIDPLKSEFVFRDFTKIDNYSQGMGIGLTIAAMITKLMDGKIYFDKEYVNGCRVIFKFPYK